MTFGDFREKLIKRWLVIGIFVVLANLLFLPRINQETYVASLGLGLNPNNPSLNTSLNNNGGGSEAYALVVDQLSFYVVNRFSSIEIQSKIGSQIGIDSNFRVETPFYSVSPQQAGFVSLNYTSSDRGMAESFIEASKSVYIDVIDEWNNSRPDAFQITPMDEFNESISVNTPSRQFQLLPTIIGILIGLALAIVLPLKKKSK